MQEFDDLKKVVAEVEEDINKAEGGNRADQAVLACEPRRRSRPCVPPQGNRDDCGEDSETGITGSVLR